MKLRSLFMLISISLSFAQCTLFGFEPAPPPKPTFKEQETKLMAELRPQMTGTWVIRQAQINQKELGYFQTSPGITRDTVLQNLAAFTLQPASTANKRLLRDDPALELEGFIEFGKKTFPIYGLVIAGPNRIAGQTGLQGYIHLEYNFKPSDIPPGGRPVEVEQDYLRGIGLMYDNFSIEIGANKRTMTWRGLNRAITSAAIEKR